MILGLGAGGFGHLKRGLGCRRVDLQSSSQASLFSTLPRPTPKP